MTLLPVGILSKGHHLQLWCKNGICYCMDDDSKFGVYVNGARVAVNEGIQLNVDDTVSFRGKEGKPRYLEYVVIEKS